MLGDPVASVDGDPLIGMKRELADLVLASYVRDEPPDLETRMIARAIGPARVGLEPEAMAIGQAAIAATPRWPAFVPPTARRDLQSKRLAIEVATDRTAAWVSDEVSWRIAACGRVAVIPLRYTALFAHDGDRWVPVVEHVSFARPPAPEPDGLVGATFKSASLDRDLSDALSHAIARAPGFVAPDATMIGPIPNDRWHGVESVQALPPVLVAEDRLVGTVGRGVDLAAQIAQGGQATALASTGAPTVAYWVGNFTIDVPAQRGKPAGRVRVRGTFVFERRPFVAPNAAGSGSAGTLAIAADGPIAIACSADARSCRWNLVQAHVSVPIRDADLATSVFGQALATPAAAPGRYSDSPISLSCGSGS